MEHKHRGLGRGLPFALVGLLLMVGTTEAQGSERELIGKRFDSISVVRSGGPHQLVEGTKIRVRFKRQHGRPIVSWHAGCNRIGARVKIRPRKLLTGQVVGTLVGCGDALARQDRWLARFFHRDPHWVRRGKRLRLRSGEDVIRLRRHTKRWLIGKRFESIAVIRNLEPHQLVEGTTIRMSFEQRKDHVVVSWHAGCNHFGARVKIRPRRLLTGQILGTQKACSDDLNRQDRWLARFFRRDPRWSRQGKRLRLRSGDDVIRLRAGPIEPE